jgi:hypothetical protein
MATSNFLNLFGRGKSAKRKADDAPVKDDDDAATAQAAEGEDGEDEEEEDGTDDNAANPAATPADEEGGEDEAADGEDEEEEDAMPADKKEAAAYRRGRAAGVRRERHRTAKVMSAPVTVGREKTAALLLASGSTPAAAIVTALASVPKSNGSHLDDAMRKLGNPPTGPGYESQASNGSSLADKQRARQEAKLKQSAPPR